MFLFLLYPYSLSQLFRVKVMPWSMHHSTEWPIFVPVLYTSKPILEKSCTQQGVYCEKQTNVLVFLLLSQHVPFYDYFLSSLIKIMAMLSLSLTYHFFCHDPPLYYNFSFEYGPTSSVKYSDLGHFLRAQGKLFSSFPWTLFYIFLTFKNYKSSL